MDKVMNQFGTMLQKFSDELMKMAPKAWIAAQQVKKFESIGYLTYGFIDILLGLIFLTNATVFAVLAGKLSSKIDANIKESRYYDEKEGDTAVCGTFIGIACVSGFIGLVMCMFGISWLSNIWNWVGVYHPDIAIYHDLYTKLTQPN